MVVDDIIGGKIGPAAVGEREGTENGGAEVAVGGEGAELAEAVKCTPFLRCTMVQGSRSSVHGSGSKHISGAFGFRLACHHQCGGRRPPQTRTVMSG